LTSPRSRRSRWAAGLAGAVSLVLMALVFGSPSLHPAPHWAWRFDPHQLVGILTAHPLAFAAVAALEALQLPLRAWLWKYVLPRGVSGQPARYHAIALGALAQNVLPARVGELVRGLSLSRSCPGLGRARSLTTVVTSKLAELAALLTFVLLIPLSMPLSGPELAEFRHGAIIAAGVLVALIGLGALLTRARGRAHRIEAALRHLPGRLGCKLAGVVEELAHGVAACSSWRRAGAAYALALATVGAAVLAFQAGLWGVGAPHSFGAATVVLGAVSLGMSIPSSPSGLGVFHLVCLYALTALGVPAANAVAFGLAVHLIGTSVNIGLGLVSLLRGHESIGHLVDGQAPVALDVEPALALSPGSARPAPPPG